MEDEKRHSDTTNPFQKPKIGVIGQGWVGKAYADNFEERFFPVVRYSLEEPHIRNKDLIKDCDYTFICVPTPTDSTRFYHDIVESVIPLSSKIVVIKSTMLPGMTEVLQERFDDQVILFSPEFLREDYAKRDVDNPVRNVVGYCRPEHAQYAKDVLELLPRAPYAKITRVRNAELAKYFGNAFLATKVVFANLMYDICSKMDIEYGEVRQITENDPRIGTSHLEVRHGGRGAGGNCFVKDFEALKQLYERTGNTAGFYVFNSIIRYNNQLLFNSDKDPHILSAVYPNVVPKEEGDAYNKGSGERNHGNRRKRKTVYKKAEPEQDEELQEG